MQGLLWPGRTWPALRSAGHSPRSSAALIFTSAICGGNSGPCRIAPSGSKPCAASDTSMPSPRKPIAPRLGRRRDEFGDLTRDLSAMAARSRALMRAQQQRVNDILHDLKSPLARLSVALGLARQQTGLDAQEALNRIELEAETLSQMLQQLLGLARVEAGMELPAAQEIDLLCQIGRA